MLQTELGKSLVTLQDPITIDQPVTAPTLPVMAQTVFQKTGQTPGLKGRGQECVT